ncbi:hypothetical protein QUC31_016486 [Theobroma cacao]
MLYQANASSGMGVAEHSKSTYMELQRKKVFRYVIFKIDEKKNEVVVEKTGGPAESYDDFTASMPENDCRYAVYDFDFVTSENCQKSKIFFIAWSPSVSRIRSKMLYATSKDRFRRELEGIHYEIQATDPTEMDLEADLELGAQTSEVCWDFGLLIAMMLLRNTSYKLGKPQVTPNMLNAYASVNSYNKEPLLSVGKFKNGALGFEEVVVNKAIASSVEFSLVYSTGSGGGLHQLLGVEDIL